MPETGDLGSLGGPIRDGALLAAIQVNDADLNVTVNTRVEDTQTDPQAGISARECARRRRLRRRRRTGRLEREPPGRGPSVSTSQSRFS